MQFQLLLLAASPLIRNDAGSLHTTQACIINMFLTFLTLSAIDFAANRVTNQAARDGLVKMIRIYSTKILAKKILACILVSDAKKVSSRLTKQSIAL